MLSLYNGFPYLVMDHIILSHIKHIELAILTQMQIMYVSRPFPLPISLQSLGSFRVARHEELCHHNDHIEMERVVSRPMS